MDILITNSIKDKYVRAIKKQIIDDCPNINLNFINVYLDDNNQLIIEDNLESYKCHCEYIEFILSDLDSYNRYKLSFKLINNNLVVTIWILIDYLDRLSTGKKAPELIKTMINSFYGHQLVVNYPDSMIPTSEIVEDISCDEIERCLKIKPYKYQLNNLQWLQNIEKKVDDGKTNIYEYVSSRNYRSIYLHKYGSIYITKDNRIYNDSTVKTIKYRYNGGVLCDQVGLGKTLSMSLLLVADKLDSKIILCKPDSYKGKNLIICPRRLVAQWKSEIKKYTDHVKVLEISTMTHVKKVDYQTIKKYDVVICSFTLLANRNYINNTDFKLEAIEWKRLIIDEGHEVLVDNVSTKKDSQLRHTIYSIEAKYKWICTGTPLPCEMNSLLGIITFISGETAQDGQDHIDYDNMIYSFTFKKLYQFYDLLFRKNTKESIMKTVKLPKVLEKTYFIDFTQTEKQIYDTVDEFDTERKLQLCTNINVSKYDSKIFGGMILGLEEINKVMARHYLNKIEDTKQHIELLQREVDHLVFKRDEYLARCDAEIKDHEYHIKNSKLNSEKKQYKMYIDTLKDEMKTFRSSTSSKIKTRNKNIEKSQDQIVFFEQQVNIFSALSVGDLSYEKCVITGYQLKGKEVAITKNGHYFSLEGLEILLNGKTYFQCPYTGDNIDMSELFLTSVEQKTSNPVIEVDPLRSRWGSKLAYIINHLNKLLDEDATNRVIIFSKWDKMLLLISQCLKSNNIAYSLVKGNIHCMTKSIRDFKYNPSVKVILLSSESCSSGSNLTEANHIFLVDAIGLNIEETKAIEEQAIGRANRIGQKRQVYVHRFVVKNTIEEKIYQSNLK
jgi:SNF2 family DNA or RNA helicase